MSVSPPYLLFLGDASHAKTAQGVRYWRPDWCVGQVRYPGCPLDLDLPDMSFAAAVAAGAKSLLLGTAPPGGRLPEAWVADLVCALEAGLDIAGGLHTRLNAHPVLQPAAARLGRRLWDFRHQSRDFEIGPFDPRPGRRLLTVGADCAVGKKFTALAIERALRARGVAADFRATGQTGVLIAGGGIVMDTVPADFIAAAAAALSPAADPDHWDVVEGQGSLFHPAYAGVTLGLIHGTQPDAMVLCADPSRTSITHFPRYPQPDLALCIERYTEAARLTNPAATVVGLAFNTSALAPAAADDLLAATAARFDLPCIDPIRTGVDPIIDRLLASEGTSGASLSS